MTTYTNGQYFLWNKKTAPATPYTHNATRVISSFYPAVKQSPSIFIDDAPALGGIIDKTSTYQPYIPIGREARIIDTFLPMRGYKSISGHAYSNGNPAERIITIFTQPPNSKFVGSYKTNSIVGTFSALGLAPGNYMIIDSMTDNSQQALIYDWVVSA